jgi:hypothetical protein
MGMSDSEFDLLDELYFVSSYEELQSRVPELELQLKNLIKSLISKGWIKCMMQYSDEEINDLEKFDLNYKKYNYLATKTGLLAHNSK